MRSLTTLGALARREAVLASLLTTAAAVVALGRLLGTPSLLVVGAIIAAVGAIARTVIVVCDAYVGKKIEKAKLDDRTSVPIAVITSIDPTMIGVEAAAQTILPGEKVPEYLPREADGQLRAAIRAALDGSEPWTVVAVGPSKVGKSRALFEALLDCGREAELDLVAPVDGKALLSLLTPSEMPRIEHECCVLWLDDLEPFFNDGVTFQTLSRWHEGAPGRIVAGTLGGKGSDQVAKSASSKLATIAGDVLQNAREVGVGTTTAGELDPLRPGLTSEVLKSIEQSGLAAYLVAAPLLERKLLTGRHVAGELECPEGVAVVYAAIDWARCGRTDPIAEETLRKLWPSYLPAGMRPTDEGFRAGSDWALRHVAGTIALLEHDGGYRAYDYIVRFARDRPGAQLPSDAAWTSSAQGVSDAKALAVGESAYQHGRYDDAIAVFEIASRSSTNEVVAIARFNLGATLAQLDRSEEALAVFEEVVARFGEEPEPALRETVARALFYKGATLGVLDRSEEALTVFEEVVARFGEELEPALCETVARALFYKGSVLARLDRLEEALAVFEDVVARFGEEPEPAPSEVAEALFYKGSVLARLDRLEEALAVFEDVVARFGEEPEPAPSEVAEALFYKGTTLARLDRLEEALTVYEEVTVRFGEEPELRHQIACVLFCKGTTLARLNRSEEALTVYEEVVARFDGEPGLREPVAYAREELAIERSEAR